MKIARRLMALLLALTLLTGNVITPVLATEPAAEPEVTVDVVPETVTEEAEESVDEESDETPAADTVSNDAAAAEADATDATDATEETKPAGYIDGSVSYTWDNPYIPEWTWNADNTVATATVTLAPGIGEVKFAVHYTGTLSINGATSYEVNGTAEAPEINALSAAADNDFTYELVLTLAPAAPVETTVQLYPNMFTFGEDQVSGTYTVTVPAGEIYNFELYNAGGMLLSIDGGEAVAMTGNMMMFSIANEGTEAAEHTLTLSHPVGSMMNPEALAELSYIDVTLAEGDNDGYYYTYTAPGAGTATFYIGSITEGVVGDIILYNENTYAQKSLLNDGVDNYGLEVTIDVNEGDVLSIQVIANEDAEGNQYPAADVSWVGSFAYVPGSRMNPIAPDLNWNADWTKADAEVSVAAGATTWFIINNGVYVVTVDGAEVEVEAALSPYGFASTVFSITNDTEEDKTYAITVDYPVGTRENPEVIEDIDYGGYAVVPENSFNGYNYIYTAPATGYISVSIGWITEGVEGDLILNNRNTYENKSLSADAVNGIVTMAVTEGDVIDIQAVALPDASYNYPAADISWTGKFSEVAPGAETNPIDITGLLSWNEQYTEAAATVTVPVGTTYFAVNHVSGMLLSIDGAEGIPMGGDFFNPAVFSITNEGEAAAEYSLTFSYPVGTQMNPEVLDGMYGGYAVIEEGNSQGYYYTYTAESTGYLNVGITWITEGVEGDIVLNNENTYQQVTVAADAVNGIATMAVTEGDVIVINAVAMPDANWNYPAAEIGWSGSLTEELPGAESAPIDITSMLSWNEKGSEATASVTVAAGATTYFAVNRVSGMLLSINDGEATVMGGDFFNPAVFSITNDGESAAVYSLVFTYPVGDYMNPEFLYYTRYIQANLEAGDQDGYYYTYIAQEEGTVVLTGEAIEGVEYDVVITNNNSYEMAWMSDSADHTVSMPVMPGDELIIQVVVSPDENWNIPAATVILYGSFIYPVGHRMNPEFLYNVRYIQANLEEGNDQGYYYTYTAAEDGILVLQGSPVKGVVYDVVLTNNTTWEMGWMSDSEDYTVSVPVSAGDEVIIQVVVSPDADWNIPAATIVLTGSFIYPEGHMMNPMEITWFSDAEVTALEEGNSQGYFYTYYCYTDGIIRMYPTVAEADVDFDVVLTNNTTWEMAWLADSTDGWLTMECHAGDTITVQVVAMPDAEWNYPAANVRLNAHYDVVYITGAEEVAAGKAVTLKALNTVTGDENPAHWFMVDDSYNMTYETDLATIDQNGKLTVKAGVSEGTEIEVWVVAANSPEGSDSHVVTVKAAPVTKVEIQGEATQTLTITADSNTLALSAVNAPDNASQAVTWKSSNTKYAIVDENGIVTANEAGIGKTVTITATAADGSGKKDTVKVKILRAVDSVDLPETAIIAAGKSLNLAKLLTINPAKASNKKVTWTVDGDLTISAAGVLKTERTDENKIVTVTVTAVDTGVTDTCKVTVMPAVTKVEIQGEATQILTITADSNTLALTAVNAPENASQDVTWKSSNTKYATVDANGVVTANDAGIGKTVTITATATDGSGKKDTVKVKILRAVDSIELPETAVIAAGKSLNLAKLLTVNPGKASNKKVTWTVDGDLTISAAGVLKTSNTKTKNDAGKVVTVTATSVDNPNETATCVVTVMVPVKSVALYVGETNLTGKTHTFVMSSNGSNTLALTAENTPSVENGVCEQAWTWKSSNTKYATVDANGVVTALQPGKTVTITATATDGTAKKAVIKIKLVQPVESVELTSEAGVAGGKTLNLAKLVTINPSNATNKGLKWSVEANEYGITVSGSSLKTKAVAEAVTVKVTVEAKDGYGYSNTFDVTVYPITKTVNILSGYDVVNGTTITLKVGQSLYLDSENLDADGAETPFQSWTWKSAKAKVASVDEDGFVTALKAGTAKITCKAADGSGKSATVTIKVVNAE